jgi:hypothetical protein
MTGDWLPPIHPRSAGNCGLGPGTAPSAWPPELRGLLGARYRGHMTTVWANVWANDGCPTFHAHVPHNDEDPALAGPSCDGRGWFRTSDLSRVKRDQGDDGGALEQGRLF